jgi:putative nucleotidyltransferase with HDIG domain
MVVDAFVGLERDRQFWRSLETPTVAEVEPPAHVLVADDYRLDRVAHAFASIVDAKSPYTGHHSEGVATIADALAALLDLDDGARATLRRASLLHDIGKLGVSNRILDKPGPLSPDEWAVVRRHPQWTMEILRRVRAFDDVARIAGAHHERLDGSGYHQALTGAQLDRPSRILAVADVAEALSAERPYRAALGPDDVLRIMRQDAGPRFDADAFSALEHVLPAWASETHGPEAAANAGRK